MKVLLIKGSPRENGNTSQLGERLLDAAEEEGHDTRKLSLVHLSLEQCTACMACQSEGRCVMRNDDIKQVENAILWADVMVLATPTHWGNMSSLMLAMFERLFGFLIQERARGAPLALNAKGKKAVIITACSTRWPLNWIFNQSRSVFSRLKEICRYSGIKITKKLVLPGTLEMKEVPTKHLKKAAKIGRRLG
ncbi:MAG: flavodoxin family protein [Planctomycetes bacterium]|nr:flavodoxin family protein [Planctomycetota bacterium]